MWNIFSSFGMLQQEKSGNPANGEQVEFQQLKKLDFAAETV
jgi:predicted double-glycine peptidase